MVFNNGLFVQFMEITHKINVAGSSNKSAKVTFPVAFNNILNISVTSKNQNMNCSTGAPSNIAVNIYGRCINNSDTGTWTGFYLMAIGS